MFVTFILIGFIACLVISIIGFILGAIGDALDAAAPVLTVLLGLGIIGAFVYFVFLI